MCLGTQLLPYRRPTYFELFLNFGYHPIFLFMSNFIRYDVAVDIVPDLQWSTEDKYKNLKVVIEIDEIVDAEKAAELELKRRRKSLGGLRVVSDRGLQVSSYSCASLQYTNGNFTVR